MRVIERATPPRSDEAVKIAAVLAGFNGRNGYTNDELADYLAGNGLKLG